VNDDRTPEQILADVATEAKISLGIAAGGGVERRGPAVDGLWSERYILPC
jgi:hypothetical protein